MASRAYAAINDNTAISAGATITAMHNMLYNPGTVLVRPAIFDLVVSSPATPNDVALDWALGRTTGAATGGANPTPLPLDYQDTAASTLVRTSSGAAITGAAVTAAPYLLVFALNQRVTWRWCAVPGSEILLNSAANAGAGLLCLASSTGTPNCTTTILWRE